MDEDFKTYVKACVDCGSNTLVVDSRLHDSGSIRRRRACPKCNYSFWTIEIEECMSDLADMVDEIASLRKENERLKKRIETATKVLKV